MAQFQLINCLLGICSLLMVYSAIHPVQGKVKFDLISTQTSMSVILKEITERKDVQEIKFTLVNVNPGTKNILNNVVTKTYGDTLLVNSILHQYTGLDPGTLYGLTLLVVPHPDLSTAPYTLTYRKSTLPSPPQFIQIKRVDQNTILIYWEAVESGVDSYNITLNGPNKRDREFQVSPGGPLSYLLRGIDDKGDYEVFVGTVANSLKSQTSREFNLQYFDIIEGSVTPRQGLPGSEISLKYPLLQYLPPDVTVNLVGRKEEYTCSFPKRTDNTITCTVPEPNDRRIIEEYTEMLVVLSSQGLQPVGRLEVKASTPQHARFIYRGEPEIFEIYPSETISSGGVPLTVEGDNLDIFPDKNPQLEFNISCLNGIVPIKTTCIVQTRRRMVCISPNFDQTVPSSSSCLALPDDVPTQSSVAIAVNNGTQFVRLPIQIQGVGKFLIYQFHPRIDNFDDGVFVFRPHWPDNMQLMEIQGSGLLPFPDAKDLYTLKIGADEYSDLDVQNNRLTCRPESRHPYREVGRDQADVVVIIGSIKLHPGWFEYKDVFKNTVVQSLLGVGCGIILVGFPIWFVGRLYSDHVRYRRKKQSCPSSSNSDIRRKTQHPSCFLRCFDCFCNQASGELVQQYTPDDYMSGYSRNGEDPRDECDSCTVCCFCPKQGKVSEEYLPDNQPNYMRQSFLLNGSIRREYFPDGLNYSRTQSPGTSRSTSRFIDPSVKMEYIPHGLNYTRVSDTSSRTSHEPHDIAHPRSHDSRSNLDSHTFSPWLTQPDVILSTYPTYIHVPDGSDEHTQRSSTSVMGYFPQGRPDNTNASHSSYSIPRAYINR